MCNIVYEHLDTSEAQQSMASFWSLDQTLTIVPIVSYSNADKAKADIIKEIKGKSGVYRWTNNTSGKSYVGSSIDLAKRLYRYYSLAHITVQAKHSIICQALIKYGYGEFSF